MNNRRQKLMLEQVSRSLVNFQQAGNLQVPPEGWIRTIRKAINMNLIQLAHKLNRKPPSVSDFEKREQQGTITLKSLQEIAEALDMKVVYAIIPKKGTLEDMVDLKAEEKAREIINRTHTTMVLEDQQNSKARLVKAYAEKKNELMNEMPTFLWD